MTARRATAAVLVLAEADRNAPFPETGAEGGDQLGGIAGVRFVAGAAGAALAYLVDMEIVQVDRAVAETGVGFGPLAFHQGRVVALETEGVQGTVVRRIEGFRIFLAEKLRMAAAVRIVTAGAPLFLEWGVNVLLALNLPGDIAHGPRGRRVAVAPVAVEAEAGLFFAQEGVFVRVVGEMTGAASLFAIQWLVFAARRAVQGAEFLVTGEADTLLIRLENEGEITAVRLVAGDALLVADGGVHDPGAADPLGQFRMTLEAEILDFSTKKMGLVGRVGIVAKGALARGGRAVIVLVLGEAFLVAGKTEFLLMMAYRQEKRLVRTVGIVTGAAFPLPHRLVDGGAVKCIVAQEAKGRFLVGELDVAVVGMAVVGDVAVATVFRYRRMGT